METTRTRMKRRSGESVPAGCRAVLPNGNAGTTVNYYLTPGGPIIEGTRNSDKFIAFLYNNIWTVQNGQERDDEQERDDDLDPTV